MKKIVPVISVIAVLVVLLTIPAAAAFDGWYSMDAAVGEIGYQCDWWYEYYYNLERIGERTSNGYSWIINSYTSSSDVKLYFVVPLTDVFSVSSGDIFSLPRFNVGGWFRGAENVMQVRTSVVACDSSGKPLRDDDKAGSTDYGPLAELIDPIQLSENSSGALYGNSVWSYTSNEVDYRCLIDYPRARLCLVFLMNVAGDVDFQITVNDKSFSFGYGNPNSPEVPSYTPPSDEDKFSDLDGAEQELAGQNQDGLDAAGAIIGDFTLQQFASGLTALVSIYNVLLPRLGWLNALISVSLALGIVSFLLNIAHSLVGKLSGSGNKSAPRKKGG